MRTPTPAQQRASDPNQHVWVSANAGTGKTGVLSDRAIRLMLNGAQPDTILCITFTKAAANEMIERIEERLAEWATEPDDKVLFQTLQAIEGSPPSAYKLALARRLFAQVLELPHGLQVMTVHSFCHSLLKRFPIEAGLPPQFEAIDEQSAAELLREVRAQTFLAENRPELRNVLNLLAVRYTEHSLMELVAEIIGKRVEFERAFDRFGTVDGYLDDLAQKLGVDRLADGKSHIAAACANGAFDVSGLTHAVQCMLRSGTAKNKKNAETIALWLERTQPDRANLFDAYQNIYLTQKAEPRKNLLGKSLTENHPELERIIEIEQIRLIALENKITAAAYLSSIEPVLQLAAALINGYKNAKTRRAALDFDDLIAYTGRLLNSKEDRDWVLYKLDQAIDHILVDEAQDTSEDQWSVVKPLIGELMAGQGREARQSATRRTAFVVGDPKQSIYSFQGADLATFDAVHGWMNGFGNLANERLEVSFRTSPQILKLVDAVLALPACADAIGQTAKLTKHVSHFPSRFGEITLWPLVPPSEQEGRTEPWALPDETHFELQAENKLAEAIAGQIRDWLKSGIVLASTGQAIEPGDILILIAKRGQIQEIIINELKRSGIPVAGADRLLLTEHLAVRDLIALGHSLLLPEDDLNLACVLKSPLLGLDDDQLFELAYDRDKAKLIDRLRSFAQAGKQPFTRIYEKFSAWRARADFVPPFELFSEILDHDGRSALIRRLGADCIEPVDAFLGQTLLYEEGHPASLQGFMYWLDQEGTTLKRTLDMTQNQVRVMTIHASKGLEAPVVILADAGPQGHGRHSRLVHDVKKSYILAKGLSDDRRPPLLQDAIDHDAVRVAQEKIRLLYVALTRAKERLLIAGKEMRRPGAGTSWHELIRAAMMAMPETSVRKVALPWQSDAEILHIASGLMPQAEISQAGSQPASQALPDWALLPAPREQPKFAIQRPSDFSGGDASVPAQQNQSARLYGDVFHRILNAVRDHNDLEFVIANQAMGFASEFDHAMRDRLVNELNELKKVPEFQRYLGGSVIIEAPFVGRIDGSNQVLSGQIDRLCVEDDGLYFLDIKTTLNVPHTTAAIPSSVLSQLAQYCRMLNQIYPHKTINAELLYTAQAKFFRIDNNMLEAGF